LLFRLPFHSFSIITKSFKFLLQPRLKSLSKAGITDTAGEFFRVIFGESNPYFSSYKKKVEEIISI
jgi:hypothetical protein